MIGWITNWWRQRQRNIDMEILWPVCVAHTVDLEDAKAVFATHAFNDPAWMALGELELREYIDALELPQEKRRKDDQSEE